MKPEIATNCDWQIQIAISMYNSVQLVYFGAFLSGKVSKNDGNFEQKIRSSFDGTNHQFGVARRQIHSSAVLN